MADTNEGIQGGMCHGEGETRTFRRCMNASVGVMSVFIVVDASKALVLVMQ